MPKLKQLYPGRISFPEKFFFELLHYSPLFETIRLEFLVLTSRSWTSGDEHLCNVYSIREVADLGSGSKKSLNAVHICWSTSKVYSGAVKVIDDIALKYFNQKKFSGEGMGNLSY